MDNFFERTFDRDLGLDVEGKIFWVSRQELADSSPVFWSMLHGAFREKEEEIIRLPEKKAEDILDFLRCIFSTDSKCDVVNEKNLYNLLDLADEYDVEKLREICSNFLMKKIEKGKNRFVSHDAWKKIQIEKRRKKINLFIIGVRYKLKEVVRGTILTIRKLDAASEIPGFNKMPMEVKNAILMPVPQRRHVELITQNYSKTCKFCNKFYENEFCSICSSCRKPIQWIDCYSTKFGICQCVDLAILAELEKVGL